MPVLRRNALLQEVGRKVYLQGLRRQLLRIGRNDIREHEGPVDQVVHGNVPDFESQEGHFIPSAVQRHKCDAEDRVVHAAED